MQKIAQQTFSFQKFVDNAQQCFALHLKQTFMNIIWMFTEGDGIESRLPFKICFTLNQNATTDYLFDFHLFNFFCL